MNSWKNFHCNVLSTIYDQYTCGLCFLQLHIGSANGYDEVVEYLLENGADIEAEDNDGWQPIHAAACWGQV